MSKSIANDASESALRDRLWDEIWRLWYRAYFAEKASELMLTRWLYLDHALRVLIAIFASSSAIAGWSLWSSDEGKKWWAALAGVAMVLSLVASALSVQERVKRFAETKTTFTRLRIRLEGIQAQMRIDPDFPAKSIQEGFQKCQESYGEALQTYPHDIFFRPSDEVKIQETLDHSFS